MPILLDLNKFRAPRPDEVIAWFDRWTKKRARRHLAHGWTLRNEVRPADLYAYLYAKFGPPNGIQNFLRDDTSDNLIHWDWELEHTRGYLGFLGMNLRTEVRLLGRWDFDELDRDQLVQFIKADLPVYGEKMKQLRRELLEDWETFINPYYHLRNCVQNMQEQLKQLEIDHDQDRFADPESAEGYVELGPKLERLHERYTRAYGITTSLTALAPVMAEAFLNLLHLLLLKPEIKKNKRLFDSVQRADIDVKAQALHLHCEGFEQPVEWSGPACRAYSRVVNARNDILHGNIVIAKLKTGEVYFNGKVPVFKRYGTLWERTFDSGLNACGYRELDSTLQAVDDFVSYVLSCVTPELRRQIEYAMEHNELGRNRRTGRIGALLPNYLVDMQLGGVSQAE